jgi:hypothetical protein
MEETTVFEKASFMNKAGRYIIVLIVVIVITGGILTWGRISAGSHKALQEARGVRTAMKLVSIEYYGGDGSIYDSKSLDGMAKGAADMIKTMSYAEGEIELKAWNEAENVPVAFTYHEGLYYIDFRTVGNPKDPDCVWDVYYAFHLMKYTTEQGSER